MSEPTSADVYVDVLFDEGLLYLVLGNKGEWAAELVKVTFDRPLIGADGVDVSRLGIFSYLSFLAPGKQIPVFLDSAHAYYARRQRSRIRLKIAWRVGRTPFESTVNHDMRAYADLPYVVKQPEPRRLGRSRR